MNNVITIDGPSGAGKSTVSKLLAKKLGYRHLDTGILYRAVAWKVRDENVSPDNESALTDILKRIDIVFKDDTVMVNGTDVTSKIRTPEISELSSRVSANPLVRAHLYAIQREIGLKEKVVMEGRDIGTAIFPEAENKFYVDASLEERSKRRHLELKKKTGDIDLMSTIENMEKRDNRDSSRQHAPLKKADDMIYIDTSSLTPDEVVANILEELKKP